MTELTELEDHNNELLPCPFCGSEVGITHIYAGEEVIGCHGCGTGMRGDTQEHLLELWNTRTDHIVDAKAKQELTEYRNYKKAQLIQQLAEIVIRHDIETN
tara:strand:+ start:683 stop:985 length:303 start_codon:yes stop_codon:yes gene_type:complete